MSAAVFVGRYSWLATEPRWLRLALGIGVLLMILAIAFFAAALLVKLLRSKNW